MEEFLQTIKDITFLGNDVLEWSLALIVFAALYSVFGILLRMLRKRLETLAGKTSRRAADLGMAAMAAIHSLTLLVVSLYVGTRFLELGPVARSVDIALIIILNVQLALCANRALSTYVVSYAREKRETDPGAITIIYGAAFLVRLLIWGVALLLILDNLGYDVTALVAGAGIGGIAVALALQNVLGDLFASLSIILDKPFIVGDFIIVGDSMGSVQSIGLKTTRIHSLSGEQLIISNSDLLNSRIRNFKRMEERRVVFSFGVIYQTSAEQLESIPSVVREIIEETENTRFDRAHFKSFGDSSLDFEVVYYVLSQDYAVYMDAQQAINLELYRRLEEKGIAFAYPTRTLYIAGRDGESPNTDHEVG
ncbi:MAG: mechanosensitive ion channel family protein [Opitutales bacterium]